MRKITTILILLFIIWLGTNYLIPKKIIPNNTKIIKKLAYEPTKIPLPKKPLKSIFVPDWNLNGETILDNGYDRWIYFGGEAKKESFVNSLHDKELWYTIKISSINELTNSQISEFEASNFKGVVLDLEISELPTEKLKLQINDGVYKFYKKAKEKDLLVALALYGDLFYRGRPYDLGTLNDYCDEVMIMAYDFHKSRGEPGPNFPFNGREEYGYDFKKMIDDYLEFIPSNKITVIFGMFGYDWLVDENKKPIRQATAFTVNEINNNFLNKCKWDNCVIRRDKESREIEVNYIYSVIKDSVGYMDMHIVFAEDEESAKIKEDYLKEKGIMSIGYWAWGYF